MIAEISVTGHVERYHVAREIYDDLDRLLMRDMSASSSFSSEEAANVLIDATVTRNKDRVNCWIATAPANNVLSLNCTFTKTDAQELGVPVRHVGVLSDPVTNRLRARRTRTVTVVIVRRDNEQGWSLYTAFPNIHNPYGTDIEQDLISLLPKCQSFAIMPEIARVCAIERCIKDDWSITYDIGSSAICFDIIENDENLGIVRMNRTMSSWEIKNESPTRLQRDNGAWLIMRALPKTYEKAHRLRETLQKIESNTMFAHTQNNKPTKPAIEITTESEPIITTIKATTTLLQAKKQNEQKTQKRAAATKRATKKALARSKAANKKKRPKTKSTTKKPTTKQIQQPTIQPYKPTKVMTKLEEKGLTQHEQNIEFIKQCLSHGIPFINKDKLEILINCNPDGKTKPIRRLKGIRVGTIDQNTYDKVMLEWESSNSPSYKNVYIPDTLQLIQACITDLCTIYGPFNTKGNTVRINLEDIADDNGWQPFVSDSMRKWVDTRCIDAYGRDVRRVCEESPTISIIEKLDLTIGSYQDTSTNIFKEHQKQEQKEEQQKLNNALDVKPPDIPSGPIDIHDAIHQNNIINQMRPSWNNPLAAINPPPIKSPLHKQL